MRIVPADQQRLPVHGAELPLRLIAGQLTKGRPQTLPIRVVEDNVADAVLYMAGLPLATNVLFMTVMANTMPFVGRG